MIYIYIFIIIILTLIFYLINNLLKKYIKEDYQGIISDSFFEELNKKNYEVDKNNKLIIYNNNKISYDKHFNTVNSIKNAKDKIITSTILSNNNIPIPIILEAKISEYLNLVIQYLYILLQI